MTTMTRTEQVHQQYQNDTNLSKRMQLHQLYSTNKQGLFSFLFEQYSFQENQRILELGCGNAAQWENRIESLPKNCTLTLSDLSFGMVKAAKEKFACYDQVTCEMIDIERIPYEDDSFDVVIANHMLYHVPNLDTALKEVARVLKPNGLFYAATNGNHGIRSYLHDVMQTIDPNHHDFEEMYSFSMQNGEEILKRYYKYVECVEYVDSLDIPSSDAIMDWISSLESMAHFDDQVKEKLKEALDQRIQQDKHILIPKECCVFIAHQ